MEHRIRRVATDELEEVGRLTVEAYRDDGYLDADDEYLLELADAAYRDREAEVWVAVDDTGVIAGSVTFCPQGSQLAEVARAGEGDLCPADLAQFGDAGWRRRWSAGADRPGARVRRPGDVEHGGDGHRAPALRPARVRPGPAAGLVPARRAHAAGSASGWADRARNCSRSTTTRVTSPWPTTRPSEACDAATWNRTSRPSTYTGLHLERLPHRARGEVLEGDARADTGLLRGQRVRERGAGGRLAPGQQPRGAEDGEVAGAHGGGRVGVGDGEPQGGAVSGLHPAIQAGRRSARGGRLAEPGGGWRYRHPALTCPVGAVHRRR